MKRTSDYLNEIARETNVFYELSEDERISLKNSLLSIYKDIANICEKYNLVVMLGGGSALGAVRHKGFIPWDDDLDLMMPRKDYDKLKDVFFKELSHKYVLSVPRQKGEQKTLFMQIIKKNTKLMCVEDLRNDETNGIRIDIYAIENLPNNYFLRVMKCYFMDILRVISLSIRMYCYKDDLFKNIFCKTIKTKIYYHVRLLIGFIFSFIGRKRMYDVFDKIASLGIDGKYCTIPTGRKMSIGECLERKDFFPVSKGVFEGLIVNLPHRPDVYLKNLYGSDYMMLPPKNKRERHFYIEFDLGDNFE